MLSFVGNDHTHSSTGPRKKQTLIIGLSSGGSLGLIIIIVVCSMIGMILCLRRRGMFKIFKYTVSYIVILVRFIAT